MNSVALALVPTAVWTVIAPFVAPAGAVTTSSSCVPLTTVAATPLNLTVFAVWGAEKFVPESVTCEIHRWDAEPGGEYSLTMHHADGDKTALSGVFQEISPPERLVYTWTWGTGGMAGRETLLTLDFEAAGDETVLHLSHSLLPDEDWAQKHSMGWGGSFNSLDAVLAS